MNLNQKNWINIDGLHDEKVVEQVGKQLNLDPLMLEDILDTSQRPKCEIYNGHLYLVLRMIRYDEHQDVTTSEQFSMVLGENNRVDRDLSRATQRTAQCLPYQYV
nr:CorA family divalent cation transporter [Reichenbachiella agariperforans]